MENEAPKYASWIPEAGGYVANGKVVSKSPIYENGKLKLDVDTSVFGNTQPQKTVQQTGMQTLNTQGSGTDVNWGMTGAGSLGSLTQNTAKTGSAISTPAIQSPLITSKPVDALEQINQRYLDAVARNDYKAMIDALVEASNYDGVDRTTQINELWKQRGEKVRTQDNAYLNSLQQIRDAITNTKLRTDLTNEEKAQQVAELQAQEQEILNKQQAYRDMVGYDDQISRDLQAIQQQTYQDYVSKYMDGINTMTNMIVQSLQGILDFQYNPYTDPALNIAQGYAVGKVKETMNATGMYDSSMTQRAITKAVAELVPIYEQMAKEEAQKNLQLLQQTASFLVDLDQHEFNMWKSQIEMRWEEANQKQKQIDNAINNANARGYYTNEEALIVGVPAGSESQQARQDAIDKLNKIEEEQRTFAQDIALAEYQHELSIDYLKEQYKQMKSYYNYQVSHPNNAGGSGGGSSSSGKVTIKTTGDNDEEITLTMDYDEAVRKGYISEKDITGNQGNTYIGQNGEEYTIGSQNFSDGFKNADGSYDMKKVEDYIRYDLKNVSNNTDKATALRDINANIIKKNVQQYANTGDYKRAYQEIGNFYDWVADSGIGKTVARNSLVGRDILNPETGKTQYAPGLFQEDVDWLLEKVNNYESASTKANAKKDIYNLMNNSNKEWINEYVTPTYNYLIDQAKTLEKENERNVIKNIVKGESIVTGASEKMIYDAINNIANSGVMKDTPLGWLTGYNK